jgi:peptide-methionine (R)-S-oxide reductase
MNRRQIMSLLSLFGLGAKVTAASATDAVARPDALRLSEAAWKQRLSAAAFRVLRQEGTEAPGAAR